MKLHFRIVQTEKGFLPQCYCKPIGAWYWFSFWYNVHEDGECAPLRFKMYCDFKESGCYQETIYNAQRSIQRCKAKYKDLINPFKKVIFKE